MDDNTRTQCQLSRRELLRAASLSGLALAGVGLMVPRASSARVLDLSSGSVSTGLDEQTEIKTLIDQYFRTRYEGQRVGTQQDFGRFTTGSPQANQFIQAERDKREVELLQASLFGLNYLKYDYTLAFPNIKVDTTTKEALVTVIEGHDVVFASSPAIVSKSSGIEHTITLRHDGVRWMIEEDAYGDDMRRMITEGGGKDAAIARMRAFKQRGGPQPTGPLPTPVPPRPRRPDTFSQRVGIAPAGVLSGGQHPYDRYAAWDYARIWANGRNTAIYNDYGSNPGNDCTNFISQCIHNGGAPMDNTGSWQWYSINKSDSYAWVNVVGIWDYLTNNTWTGPYGVAAWVDSVDVGDLLQLDFGGGWGHCPIITTKAGQTFDTIYVAAHSYNHFDYPIFYYTTAVGWRFCKIWGYYD